MRTIETAVEEHILYALALMCGQYIGEEVGDREILDHICIGAGEEACKVLYAYGLIDTEGRGATWTQAGQDLLNLPLSQKPFP